MWEGGTVVAKKLTGDVFLPAQPPATEGTINFNLLKCV